MNNGNGNKPKLELQMNIPTIVKLMQNNPAKGESQFGKWWLYNAEDGNRNECTFFAPEPVQKFIEENKLRKGDVIQITKTLTKNGKGNRIDFNTELILKHQEQEVLPLVSNGKPDDIKIMRECLMSAIELQKELGSVVDVNRVGLSLYIAKTKNGYGYHF